MIIGSAPRLVSWWKVRGGTYSACPVVTTAPLPSQARLGRAPDDEVDLLLLVVVPGHLAAVGLAA